MAIQKNRNMQNMQLINYVILLTFFVHFNCAIEINRHDDGRPVKQFDFLGDLKMKIQQAQNVQPAKLMDGLLDLSDTFKRLYFSMANYIFTDSVGVTGDKGITSSVLSALQESRNVTSSCINDTARLITSLLSREPWAVQFVDASGKPGPSLTQLRLNFVGNYDQCRDAFAPVISHGGEIRRGFRGNYCVISIQTGIKQMVPTIGACVPSTCSEKEISTLTSEFLNSVRIRNMTFQGVDTECRAAETKVTTATVISIVILSILGVMLILGTSFDIIVLASRKKESLHSNPPNDPNNQKHEYENKGIEENGETSHLLALATKTRSQKNDSHSPVSKILLAFSVYSNSKKLLDSSQAQGSLGAIHGIRFVSMSWVVLCHTYGKLIGASVNSATELPSVLDRWTFLPISNGFVSVDSFFTLSGLLTSYLTVKEMMKRKTWKINWPMFYFHRFWRLTPPYMFILVIVLGLQQYLGQGPLWKNDQPGDKRKCERNWWTNLLYINNLVRTDEICFIQSWYLANDMQFFVISPLMLIPFYFHRLAGILNCCAFLLITWITTGVLSTDKGWPTTFVSLKPNPNTDDYEENYYIAPWCRIGPFIIGIMAGYVLAITNGRLFRMRWWLVALGWILSLGCALAVVYGIRGDINGRDVSSTAAASFYNLIHSSVWGACVSWVILACSAGYGGPVNTLLSWSPFVVLGRLTYMSYLIHLNLLTLIFQNFEALLVLNDTTFVILFLGILVLTNMVSFVFALALESPMVGLEKALLRKDKK